MILEFRTERDRNGNALYLAIDTSAEMYSTNCSTWISKEFPVLKRRDRQRLIDQLKRNGYIKKDHICQRGAHK